MRLGFGEILVILVLALLFFGPSKLPALGASLGEAIKGFKRGLQDANEDKPEQVAAVTPAATPAVVKPPSAQA
jgi:sec-independent protein translocase protein TatA